MPEKYQTLIQRNSHGAATITVNSDSIEVILFGGYDKHGSRITDTTVLSFGELIKAINNKNDENRSLQSSV